MSDFDEYLACKDVVEEEELFEDSDSDVVHIQADNLGFPEEDTLLELLSLIEKGTEQYGRGFPHLVSVLSTMVCTSGVGTFKNSLHVYKEALARNIQTLSCSNVFSDQDIDFIYKTKIGTVDCDMINHHVYGTFVIERTSARRIASALITARTIKDGVPYVLDTPPLIVDEIGAPKHFAMDLVLDARTMKQQAAIIKAALVDGAAYLKLTLCASTTDTRCSIGWRYKPQDLLDILFKNLGLYDDRFSTVAVLLIEQCGAAVVGNLRFPDFKRHNTREHSLLMRGVYLDVDCNWDLSTCDLPFMHAVRLGASAVADDDEYLAAASADFCSEPSKPSGSVGLQMDEKVLPLPHSSGRPAVPERRLCGSARMTKNRMGAQQQTVDCEAMAELLSVSGQFLKVRVGGSNGPNLLDFLIVNFKKETDRKRVLLDTGNQLASEHGAPVVPSHKNLLSAISDFNPTPLRDILETVADRENDSDISETDKFLIYLYKRNTEFSLMLGEGIYYIKRTKK